MLYGYFKVVASQACCLRSIETWSIRHEALGMLLSGLVNDGRGRASKLLPEAGNKDPKPLSNQSHCRRSTREKRSPREPPMVGLGGRLVRAS